MSRFHIALSYMLVALVLVIIMAEPPARTWYLAFLLALFFTVTIVGVFCPRLSFFLPIFSRGRAGRGRVALTFDDGPDPEATPAALAVLDRLQAPAAFFLIGEKARAHPDLVKRIVQGGHLVGNHSFSHFWWMNFLFGRRLLKEIMYAQAAIGAIIGRPPALYRPPVGLTNPHLNGALKKAGLTCVGFDVRLWDRGADPEKVLTRLFERTRDGSIILLHDGGADPSYLASLLERVIRSLPALGFKIVRLDELAERPAYQGATPALNQPDAAPPSDRRPGLIRRLAAIPFIRQAIEERADLSVFKDPPSLRLLAGVLLIGLGMLMGLPAVSGLGIMAVYLRDPLVFVFGGPASYAASWAVWGLGMWLAGPDNIMYLRSLLRWAARITVERLAGAAPPSGRPGPDPSL
ncbi:MAG: polysaccharide deacetylase family protein [Thermodesulfobacteriota bacterium]